MKSTESKPDDFRIDEVIEIKGKLFKTVLIDWFTGIISFKRISEAEAKSLRENPKPVEEGTN